MKPRDQGMDLMKLLLVAGMVLAHVIQFFGAPNPMSQEVSDFVNMITFPGFLFCFGYVGSIAYFRKEWGQVWKKLLVNTLKMLGAFYFSGISYELFVNRVNFRVVKIFQILILQIIPGYSEFLIAFAVLNLLMLILFKPIRFLLAHELAFFAVIIGTLAVAFINYDGVTSNYLGLLVGTRNFPSFPVVQYAMFFLLGAYFQKKKIGLGGIPLGISAVAGCFILKVVLLDGHFPERFPPELAWILAPTFFLYLSYIGSKYLADRVRLPAYVVLVGSHTLVFLLSSNIIIFLVRFLMDRNLSDQSYRVLSFHLCLLFSGVIIGLTCSGLKSKEYVQSKKDSGGGTCRVQKQRSG